MTKPRLVPQSATTTVPKSDSVSFKRFNGIFGDLQAERKLREAAERKSARFERAFLVALKALRIVSREHRDAFENLGFDSIADLVKAVGDDDPGDVEWFKIFSFLGGADDPGRVDG